MKASSMCGRVLILTVIKISEGRHHFQRQIGRYCRRQPYYCLRRDPTSPSTSFPYFSERVARDWWNCSRERCSASCKMSFRTNVQWYDFSSRYLSPYQYSSSNFYKSYKESLCPQLMANIRVRTSWMEEDIGVGKERGLFMMSCSRVAQFLPCHGSLPKTSQQKITPNDHISHFLEYSILCSSWGAMQQGVPTCDRSRKPSLATYLAIPKSANLATPLLRSILAGFRSLCTMPCRANSLYPCTICLSKATAFFSPHPTSVKLRRSPSHLSITMKTACGCSITSYTLTMWGWLSWVRMRISLASSRERGCRWRDEEEGSFIYFIAKSPSACTRPKLPLPMTDPRVYFPAEICICILYCQQAKVRGMEIWR